MSSRDDTECFCLKYWLLQNRYLDSRLIIKLILLLSRMQHNIATAWIATKVGVASLIFIYSLYLFKKTDHILSGKKCVHLARKTSALARRNKLNLTSLDVLEHESANDDLYLTLLYSSSI